MTPFDAFVLLIVLLLILLAIYLFQRQLVKLLEQYGEQTAVAFVLVLFVIAGTIGLIAELSSPLNLPPEIVLLVP